MRLCARLLLYTLFNMGHPNWNTVFFNVLFSHVHLLGRIAAQCGPDAQSWRPQGNNVCINYF